jgi:two-component system, cell cycle sensor histidine kinase and response regulator CckA
MAQPGIGRARDSWEDVVAGWPVVRRLLPRPNVPWAERQTGAALVPLCVLVAAACAVYLIVNWIRFDPAANFAAGVGALGVALLALALIRQGRVTGATWLFMVGLALLTATAMLGDGLRADGVGNVLVVTGMAAVLLNWRGAVFFAAFYAVILIAAVVGESRGWLAPPPREPPNVLATALMQLIVLTTVLGLTVSWLRKLVRQLRDSERELRAANQALVESREALSLIISESPDAIIAAGDRGVIQLVNGAAERLLGYRAAELVGRPFLEVGLVADQGAPDKGAELGRVLAGMEGPPAEMEILRKDGTRVPVEVAGRMVKRGDGSMQVQAILRNIEERKQSERARAELEAELRQAQRLESVGRLAGGIAHDFNNLLTVILSTASTLRHRPLTPDQQGEVEADVDAIQAAAQRAADLTRQLLAFSRKQILRPQVVDLAEVIVGVENILRRLLPERIELRLHQETLSGPVKADPHQIQQVVMNLAINARDAMPAGGRLTVSLDEVYIADHEQDPVKGIQAGKHARITVSDTGVGMDQETRAHLFEPFFTTKPLGQGSGLGLATVHGIINQSGGHIQVRSAPGQGTSFQILLPLLPARSHHPEPRPAIDGPPPPVTGETILLVEDEPLVRQMTARLLRAMGYQVLEAANAAEALRLALARPTPVDLLLTDVVMPGASGPDLAARLAAHHAVPVLFMSGHTDVSLAETDVLERSPFLAKPFSPDELRRKVREVLHGRSDQAGGAAPAP